ncbi:MAG: 3-phosphoshikimate 1-carboxyvinyltransferase [Rhodobacteraceae bacterium]|nr:3-phosphoshikimate 1-carboxyvinyltransferase [Paracoccaceae bacterium]
MTARKSPPLKGVARVPGDKSVSHRSLILGALAVGETRISGLLEGRDVLNTAEAMAAFGADVVQHGDGEWSVHGVGTGGFAEPEDVINCGNAGTGVRLIMGAMATSPVVATFTGDASLRSRPMARITGPLALFGAQSFGRSGGRLPLTVVGADNPLSVRYVSPHASAQIKSAVLFAGLNAPGETILVEETKTRDHSERMMKSFGARIETRETPEGFAVHLQGQPELKPRNITVPRDPSSAAFPVCAALIIEGSDIIIPGIGLNPTRAGLFITLREMGADLTCENEREESGEPVADLHVRSSGLTGIEVPPDRVASMIDEYPILSVVASFASGKTIMRGIRELRVKESDRIDAMARGLEANGVRVTEGEDYLIVHGHDGRVPGGGTAKTRLDHRIAMSFLCLGCAADKPVSIDDGGAIATSFPIFERLMTDLGAQITRTNA